MNSLEIIKYFNLQTHIEGGYYKETYKSKGKIQSSALPKGWGEHSFSTGIYFLLNEGEYSHLHRIRQDEMWHFYLGGPLRLVMLSPNNIYQEVILGQNYKEGEFLQFVVPAGVWFGATPCVNSKFSFVGCTVAPGFEFTDFELAKRELLLDIYPDQSKIIHEFTQN